MNIMPRGENVNNGEQDVNNGEQGVSRCKNCGSPADDRTFYVRCEYCRRYWCESCDGRPLVCSDCHDEIRDLINPLRDWINTQMAAAEAGDGITPCSLDCADEADEESAADAERPAEKTP